MTDKRFTRDNHTGYLYDNGEIVDDIMELLNSLADENEQLKEENRKLRLKNGKLTHDLFWANKMIEEGWSE